MTPRAYQQLLELVRQIVSSRRDVKIADDKHEHDGEAAARPRRWSPRVNEEEIDKRCRRDARIKQPSAPL